MKGSGAHAGIFSPMSITPNQASSNQYKSELMTCECKYSQVGSKSSRFGPGIHRAHVVFTGDQFASILAVGRLVWGDAFTADLIEYSQPTVNIFTADLSMHSQPTN